MSFPAFKRTKFYESIQSVWVEKPINKRFIYEKLSFLVLSFWKIEKAESRSIFMKHFQNPFFHFPLTRFHLINKKAVIVNIIYIHIRIFMPQWRYIKAKHKYLFNYLRRWILIFYIFHFPFISTPLMWMKNLSKLKKTERVSVKNRAKSADYSQINSVAKNLWNHWTSKIS